MCFVCTHFTIVSNVKTCNMSGLFNLTATLGNMRNFQRLTLEQHPPNIKPNVVDQGIKAGRAAIIDFLVSPTTLDNLNLPSELTTDPLSSTGAASTSCGQELLRSAEDGFGK